MDHAKTIAMATDLLAEGRAEDVVQMVDPLLGSMESSSLSTGQLLLRGVRAQVEVLHRDRPDRALELLPPLSSLSDQCTCVRAEVALWRGWARTRQPGAVEDSLRALRLLNQAEELFDSIHDPRGRGWAMLGQAQAQFVLDEYALMRHALSKAQGLVDRLDDQQAHRWMHDLSIPALRFEGRFDEAEEHLHALRALGRRWNDRRVRGTATAHEAALRHDLGQSPADIIDTAETAEALLRRTEPSSAYPLLAAYRAHIGALLRQGRWADVDTVFDEAESAVRDDPAGQARVLILRARLALRRGHDDHAEALITDLAGRAKELPHGRHYAPVAQLQGQLLARQGDPEEAYTWMQRAHRNAHETGHRGRQLRTLLLLARLASARSDARTAREHLDAADAYDDYYSVLPFAVDRFAADGAIAQSTNRTADAIDAYRQALSAASMIQDRYRTASLQLALAQLEDDERAHSLASAAQSTFDDLDAPEEAKVAAALANGTAPPEAPQPSTSPHPDSSAPDSALADTLGQASLSVPLVANAWLQTAAALLPDRWLGIYRISSDGIASLLQEHGTRPEPLAPPSASSASDDRGPVQWLRLQDTSPTLVLGVQVDRNDDPDWDRAHGQIADWAPLVRLALQRARLHQRAHSATGTTGPPPELAHGLVAESDAMETVVGRMAQLAASSRPVLVTGESGVGKQLMSQSLHASSPRAEGPLCHVACATMQQTPVAERLFGVVQSDGALVPGAVQDADGGTLLIEDVDALPSSAQSTLLHLLDTGEVVPEGGTDPVPVDVRVVATTSERLDDLVRNDRFRPALHERLQIATLHVPPLRERRADIPLLTRHFLNTLQPAEGQGPRPSITQPAMEALLRYDWPGNVRQLRNEIERVLVHVASEPAQTIDRDILLDTIVEEAQSDTASAVDDPDTILHPNRSLDDVLSQTEATVIERVLRACEGQVTASAEVLGLSRQGLYKKMKRLGIDAADFQSDSEPATVSS